MKKRKKSLNNLSNFGNSELIYKTVYESPIGKIFIYSDGFSLIEVRFYKSKYKLIDDNVAIIKDDLEVFDLTKSWLNQYFKGEKPLPTVLPLKFFGSEFQKKVWNILYKIPYGEVLTYKDIARKISLKMFAQAVGNAVSHSPFLIIVPCHRVIGTNHKLIGFSAGLDVKKYLLQLENVSFK